MSRFRTIRLLAASCVVLGILAGASALADSAGASTPQPTPRAPHTFSSEIEPLATYVGQVSCDPHTWPGTAKLATLLASTYRASGATMWAAAYPCGTDGSQSEHYEGRAIDWMASARIPSQHAAALAAITWLLATDSAGNQFAMARRLGVMYVIYNNRMWGAWDGQWEPYLNCASLKSHSYDSMCHRNHVHISLSWNGAMGRTSFWTGRVSPTDFGPCRPADLNWAYLYTGPNYAGCRDYAIVRAAKGATALKRTLVTWSGAAVRANWTGPAVSAVQAGLRVPVTGVFDARTVSAVRAFQASHHCAVSGAMNPQTWRALLAATR